MSESNYIPPTEGGAADQPAVQINQNAAVESSVGSGRSRLRRGITAGLLGYISVPLMVGNLTSVFPQIPTVVQDLLDAAIIGAIVWWFVNGKPWKLRDKAVAKQPLTANEQSTLKVLKKVRSVYRTVVLVAIGVIFLVLTVITGGALPLMLLYGLVILWPISLGLIIWGLVKLAKRNNAKK